MKRMVGGVLWALAVTRRDGRSRKAWDVWVWATKRYGDLNYVKFLELS